MISVFSRTYPTLFRLVGYFICIFLMGAHAFFSFYLVRLLMKSSAKLFYIDSDLNAKKRIRSKEYIGIYYFFYVISISTLSALCAFLSYISAIHLFDTFIAPQTIDMDFAPIYGAAIVSNILVPFEGVIKSQGSPFVKSLALKCNHLMTLFYIAIIVLAGFDPAYLPYAWLSSSLTASLIVAVCGLVYWIRIGHETERPEGSRLATRAIWQEIIACSMKRTNNRATFLIAKGAISALLGPFSGLVLKAIGFDEDGRQQRYMAKLKKRPLIEKFGHRIPGSVKGGMTRAQILWIVVGLFALIIAAMIFMHGTPNTLLLLGLFVAIAKIISVSGRFFGLPALTLPPKDVVIGAKHPLV